jgi:hypothetical protein
MYVFNIHYVHLVGIKEVFTQHTDFAGKAVQCIAINIRLLLTIVTGAGDVSIISQSCIALNKHPVYRASKFRRCTKDTTN